MKIKVLLENKKPEKSNLCIEHGLSFLIEKDNKRILFDIGGLKGCAIKNATILGEDLSKIDAVILSHGHNDHTGGLLDFFKINTKAPVYLKKEALNPFYSQKVENRKFIGTDKKIAEEYYSRLKFVNSTLQIIPDIFLIPHINKIYPLPSSNNYLLTENNKGILKDNFNHELFMVIKEEKLTILAGCAHNGIKNIISTATEIFPGIMIKNFIGGLHLQAGSSESSQAQEEEIKDMIEFLKDEKIGNIFTGHCTGSRGLNMMKYYLKDKVEGIYSGMVIV